MKSIIQSEKECFVCGAVSDLDRHHIFYGTANRRKSEEFGLWIWLCKKHHNMSDEGIHFNRKLDTEVKQMAQGIFEDTYIHEDFVKIFGRNYLP